MKLAAKKGQSIKEGIQLWSPQAMFMILAGFLLASSIFYAMWSGKNFSIYVPRWKDGTEVWNEKDKPDISFQKQDIVEVEGYSLEGEYVEVELQPIKNDTEEHLVFRDPKENDPIYSVDLKVNRFGNIYDPRTGNYTGYEWVLLSLSIFIFAMSIWLWGKAKRAIKKDRYDYKSVFYSGLAIYLISVGIILFIEWVAMLRNPYEVTRWTVWTALADSGKNYMIFTLPFLVAFAVSMTVSNISLIRHEGRRFKNIIGMLLGIVLLAGAWIGIWLGKPAFEDQVYLKWWKMLMSVYTSGYVFLECMLIGTIVCALMAVRHIPEADKDYIVILGCGFAPDGHLYPLLRGRVDKAIEFRELQIRLNGKKAVFVPSGGQGKDEPISEAEAMKRYLLEQGYREKDIIKEDQSTNTFENMKFSKRLIEKQNPDSRSMFVTTNYHLFRSGIVARKNGFMADGLGSRTKWYFWPNAFTREFLGLMHAKFYSSLIILVIMIAVYALITFMGGN